MGKRSFWSKAEEAGDVMEIGGRSLIGLLFSFLFLSIGYWAGAQVWTGLGVMLSIAGIFIGFPIGFFWIEIKFLMKLTLKSIFDV